MQKYEDFIQGILIKRGRTFDKSHTGYKEVHHIIPKCLGGDNSESNLIELTAKEHYIAHQLLVEEYPNNTKLLYAFGAMGQSNKSKRDGITADEYEIARKAYSKANSLNNTGENNGMFGVHRFGKDNPNYGKKHPGMGVGSKNGMWGKHPIFSDERNNKISEKHKQLWNNYSEEEYEKRCEERRGSKNGMFGRYGVSPRSVGVRCVETGEEFVSISDAERNKGIVGVKAASKIGGLAGGYHWERITNS